MTQGRFLKPGDGNVAVISERLADSLGVKLNDTMKLPTTQGVVKLAIVGLTPGRALAGDEQVLITLTQAQKLLDAPGRINVIEANLTTKDKAAQRCHRSSIRAQLGNTYTLGGLTSGSEFATTMQNSAIIFNMIGFLALAMGGFIIFNTFRTIVAERRHDIGMLRALGANRATVRGLVLTEGLVQGVIGTAIGIGLGYLLGAGIIAGLNPFMKQLMNIDMTPVVDAIAVCCFDRPGCRRHPSFRPAACGACEPRDTDGSAAAVARRDDAADQSRMDHHRRGDADHRRCGLAQRQLCARRTRRSFCACRPRAHRARAGQTGRQALWRFARADLSPVMARASSRRAT